MKTSSSYSVIGLVMMSVMITGCGSPAVGLALNVVGGLTGGGGATSGSQQSGVMSQSLAKQAAQSALGDLDQQVHQDCVDDLRQFGRPPSSPLPAVSPGSSGSPEKPERCQVRLICLSGMRVPIRTVVCDNGPEESGASDNLEAAATANTSMPRQDPPWSFERRQDYDY